MKKNKTIFLFLLALVIINVIQSCFTGLLHDEAYYWLWSKQLAWGYFDHPPMIALFIALGDSLFHNEIGVRLLSILAGAATIYMLFRIINPSNQKLFYVILISITPLLGACFFAVPDTPLLLFTACFFLVYKKYSEDDSLTVSLLLGVCMALMLYSKYHGVLVIFFVLLSDLSLLKRKSFYIACITGALLFMPHLWWQWQNDFPTFRFQLFGRFPEVYSPLRIADYLGGQLLLMGIPTGLILFYALLKQKTENKFERALYFQFAGTLLFFLLASFKGRTEANWTVTNIIPLTILSYKFLENNLKLTKWLHRLLPVSAMAIAFIRIHYATDLAQQYLKVPCETQHWKEWADSIKTHAGERPVVFLSSYQKASKYAFYSGNTSFTTTEVGQRRSQFNLWNTEEELQNKEVYVCTYWGLQPLRAISSNHIKTKATEFDGFVVDSFLSWNKIVIEPLQKSFEAKAGEEIAIPISVKSPYTSHPLPNKYSHLTYRFYGSDKLKLGDKETGILLEEALGKNEILVKVKVPDIAGQYDVFVSASQDNYPPPINSTTVKVEVK